MPARTLVSASTRQRRGDVERAVLDAMVELAAKRPFSEITVEEIAHAAGISRTAFYFYFRGKTDLLLRAVEAVAEETYREVDRWWHGKGDPHALIRQAVAGTVALYVEQADLLRIAHEVSAYDLEVRAYWHAMVERFTAATTEHLERERAAGRLRPLDPAAAAESLVWMTERCVYVFLGLGRRSPAEVTDTLAAIWTAALYPD
jgi:TetR/AcrR family transcriptional regulator, ethionamide resistance regulator